jgi:hypothetical protein
MTPPETLAIKATTVKEQLLNLLSAVLVSISHPSAPKESNSALPAHLKPLVLVTLMLTTNQLPALLVTFAIRPLVLRRHVIQVSSAHRVLLSCRSASQELTKPLPQLKAAMLAPRVNTAMWQMEIHRVSLPQQNAPMVTIVVNKHRTIR